MITIMSGKGRARREITLADGPSWIGIPAGIEVRSRGDGRMFLPGMKFLERFFGRSAPPELTRKRTVFALAVALAIDGLQFGLGPFGWVFVDEGLDVLGMVVISWAIGFHALLLPTFLIELIPGPDMLPTWTGCTAAVILLRHRTRPQQAQTSPPIDIVTEVTPVASAESGHSEATAAATGGIPPKISHQH